MSLDVYLTVEVDTGGAEPHCVRLYEANITHNLGRMADAAGLYRHLWRPDEIDVTHAVQLIEPLREGLRVLRSDPARFKAMNPVNGWGDYEGLIRFAENYLAACNEHPKALVGVSR